VVVDDDLTAALAALRAVGRRSSVARGLQGGVEQRLLQSIVDATASLFDAEASSIALFETDPDRLEFRVAAGAHGAGAVGLVVKPTEGIAGFVFSTGQALALSDVASDPRFDVEAVECTGYVLCTLVLVPLLDDDGSVGERNPVSCGAIEKKMGIHGNPTCVLNYDGAKGWLVGEPEKGLAAMFIMMNAARLGVGLQGLAQAEVAYQNALAYARERRQGRALVADQRDADAKADPIIVHPDVRRMLMEMKSFLEGARALVLWGALQVDLSRRASSEEERQEADDLVSLLTPVIKGYLTDKGFDSAVLAQQVFVFLRSLLKVGYYAGVSEALTRVPSPEYSYVPAAGVAPPPSVSRAPDEAAVDGPSGTI